MIRKLIISCFALYTFIFIIPNEVQAQKCGTRCDLPRGFTCLSNSMCSEFNKPGICVERSCSVGDPCCKTREINERSRPRPKTPTPAPTRAPVDNPGNPGNPVVPTGRSIVPVTPGATGGPNPPDGSITPGDCSGPAEGTADGKVDLIDFNLLRKELSGSASTKKCDFDTNNVVDLLDFNIFRISFIAQI